MSRSYCLKACISRIKGKEKSVFTLHTSTTWSTRPRRLQIIHWQFQRIAKIPSSLRHLLHLSRWFITAARLMLRVPQPFSQFRFVQTPATCTANWIKLDSKLQQACRRITGSATIAGSRGLKDTQKSALLVTILNVNCVWDSRCELRWFVACRFRRVDEKTRRLFILLLFLLRLISSISYQFTTSGIYSVAELRSASSTSSRRGIQAHGNMPLLPFFDSERHPSCRLYNVTHLSIAFRFFVVPFSLRPLYLYWHLAWTTN